MADPGPEFGDHVVSTEHEFITRVWGQSLDPAGSEARAPGQEVTGRRFPEADRGGFRAKPRSSGV